MATTMSSLRTLRDTIPSELNKNLEKLKEIFVFDEDDVYNRKVAKALRVIIGKFEKKERKLLLELSHIQAKGDLRRILCKLRICALKRKKGENALRELERRVHRKASTNTPLVEESNAVLHGIIERLDGLGKRIHHTPVNPQFQRSMSKPSGDGSSTPSGESRVSDRKVSLKDVA